MRLRYETPEGGSAARWNGNAVSGSHSYDVNGNLLNDSRKSLNFSYNVLNLVNEVRTDGTLTAVYTWLADGTKLGVRNGISTQSYQSQYNYGINTLKKFGWTR